MSIRKKRIIGWIVWLVFAFACILADKFNLQKLLDSISLFKEKIPLTVCVPNDMEKAFKVAFKASGLSSDYKIEFTSEPNSNISVSYGKENDPTYTKFAFSPFVIAYNTDTDYFDALKESKVLIPSEFQKNYSEIDFLKVINEVIEEGSWSNLGIEDLEKIKVFYPSKESIYWIDFYDFMLVTVNNGIYPKTEQELQKSVETIDRFINSPYTEEVSDFHEQVSRVGGFPESAFFILPEKIVFDIYNSISSTGSICRIRILYPTATVYFNYYVKGDDLGNSVISAFETSKFYSKLHDTTSYRSTQNSNIYINSRNYIEDERNVFNVIKIPANKITITLFEK